MGCSNYDRAELFRKIQEMQFVAAELQLYLDTHPDDKKALNDFNDAVNVLQQYMKIYEDEYGSLLSIGYHGTSTGTWDWIDDPWPWEL